MGFAAGMQAGTQLGSDIIQQMNYVNQQKKQQALGDLTKQYFTLGSQEEKQPILGQIAGIDPNAAAQVQKMEAAYAEQQAQKMKSASQLAQTVMKAEPKQRNSVYKAALNVAGKYGIDVSNLPQEYTPEAEEFLNSLVSMTSTESEYKAESTIGKIEQDYRRGGILKEDYIAAKKKATTSTPQTQIFMGAEKEEQKGLAQSRVEKYNTVQAQASSAEQQNNMLASMEQALQDPEAYTGAGGNIVNEAKVLAESLGLEVEGTDSEAIIRSTGNKLALQMRSPDSGMGMPGSMSDPDRRFLVASVPGNTKTRSQNIAMISMQKKLNNRKIELANLQQQYLDTQGTLKGFEKYKKNYVDSHPLFSEEEKKRYKVQLSGKEQRASVNDPLGIR